MTATSLASRVRGLIVPIITPFEAGGAIDWLQLEAHCRRCMTAGVDVLFVHGTTGEFYGLTLEERRQVVQRVLSIVSGRIPVVVGISGDSTVDALSTLAACRDHGVSGYVASTPYLLSYSQGELVDHFHALADAVGHSIILYNFPLRYRHRIDVETVAALVADGTAHAIKDTGGDFAYLTELVGIKRSYPTFRIFESSLQNLARSAPLGIDGTVQALANLLPHECAELWSLVERLDLPRLSPRVDAMWAFHGRIESVATFITALKGAMAARGWCQPGTAAPTRCASPAQIDAVRLLLQASYPLALDTVTAR